MAKLLVVDDSRLSRRIITGALEKAGHDVTQATNGAEGLRAFHELRPDCVVSDLLMPELDGFGLAEGIRSVDPDQPVIILTADIQERSRERCEELRVTAMLNKPVKADEIAAAVQDALGSTSKCEEASA